MEGLSAKEKELEERLKNAGVGDKKAKTLVTIAGREGITGKEIDEVTQLQQPQVSLAVTALKERDWIRNEKEENEGRGAPKHNYYLEKDMASIVEELEDEEKKRIQENEKNIEEMRELADELY